ncbi:phosphate regulon sensor histidine kinase PhoR [Porticoccaceae bacterium]|jgi:two-component system phosphate regulon sensor histidine kinase PhoR|nr:phosphate regulon sensor histidine kinase PhoR [Porticoccaceae bacterium]CAI8258300.1 MAG: Phosphate regulon sensor protein PhoR [SAR92 bacterium MED-G29]|tara:strand:- start:4566 stop:5825 length:1260 start_codon:yes stop_codon:yes gene_type:complete
MHTEIWRIVLVGLFTVFFGWSLGYPLEIVLIGAGCYLIWTFRIIGLLFNWIDKGMRGIPPDADGVWGEISDTLNRQRRRHRRGQEKMRRTINRVTRLTEALDQGILVLRSDLTLDWWNSAAKNLVGLRSSDRGSAIMNLIRDPLFVDYMHKKEFVGTIELPSIIQEGRLLEFSASSFGDDEIVLVIADITRLNNLETVRKEFVGNISHELRTPLTVIKGYIETLGDSPNNTPSVDKAFEQMATQVNRMQLLADDLILLSQFEADGQTTNRNPINLNNLLCEIIVEAEQLSSGKHSLHLNCPDSLSITSEMSAVRSALGNIVFNAVRHNSQGATIRISVVESAETVSVAIADDGVGIDPLEIPRLTERFYRGDSSRNSTTGGSGLGLAIAKHAMTRCEGSLQINSSLGEGSEFTCRFPVL